MEISVEKLEKSMAKITVTLDAAEFDKALDKTYQRNKNRFNIPGFRRGHATRALIEKLYGEGVFYEEAAERLINESYPEAVRQSELEVVSRPEIDITNVKASEPFIYTAEVAVKPPVTLGEYKGIEVVRADADVSDEEVEREIERVRESNARIISIDDQEYGLKEADTAVIDFEGRVDGVAFAGGKGEDYPLVIGSKSFIDNFEEQLIGAKTGEERLVKVTFPTPYQEKSLEGKAAEFSTLVKEIKKRELPELDDEFASEVSEFDTLDEYRESVRKELKEKKEKAAAQENESRVIKAVADNAKVEIPDALVEDGIDDRVEEAKNQLKNSGLTLEQFLKLIGQSMEEFREGLRADVTQGFRVRLVFEEIAKKEGTEIGDAVDMVVSEAKLVDPEAEKPKTKEKPETKEKPKTNKKAVKKSDKEKESPSDDETGKDEVEF